MAYLEGLVSAKQQGFQCVCVKMENEGLILKLMYQRIQIISLDIIVFYILCTITQTFEEDFDK